MFCAPGRCCSTRPDDRVTRGQNVPTQDESQRSLLPRTSGPRRACAQSATPSRTITNGRRPESRSSPIYNEAETGLRDGKKRTSAGPASISRKPFMALPRWSQSMATASPLNSEDPLKPHAASGFVPGALIGGRSGFRAGMPDRVNLADWLYWTHVWTQNAWKQAGEGPTRQAGCTQSGWSTTQEHTASKAPDSPGQLEGLVSARTWGFKSPLRHT
jgi:hypothetical protein